ncbi:hypothetical protein LTR37_012538 [Vermiconidia calcicola]|uniref:Uncharacterized protein n=1 Tax=Vermiconidia calcicola TaxID=1690605 RepID=A0ACC3N0N3_9PEZI|nr:hypothetical protein LTR37_012538 [Vermiconidia calcicola]
MALSRHSVATSRPLSVEEIVQQAQDFEFVTNRSLKNWLRSAQLLLTEAAICEQDGDLQKAYLYLYRHAELVIGKFPKHPEYKDPKLKVDLAQAQKVVQKNLIKLEQWKPRINQQHQRYLKAVERRNAEKQRVQEEQLHDERQFYANDPLRQSSIRSEDGAFDHDAQALDAHEHKQLAVDLAHHEIRRRDASKQSTQRAGLSPSTVAARGQAIVAGSPEQHDRSSRHHYGFDTVSEGIREAGRHLHHQSSQTPPKVGVNQRTADPSSYQYPSVPTKESALDWRMPALQPSPKPESFRPPPALPTKEALEGERYQHDHYVPPVPPRPRDLGPPSPSTATPSPPPAPQQTPPSKYTFKPAASTEAGTPLRTVLLPPDLRSAFLNLAHHNTSRNLETCGILCGTLISNALFINHLIIPDQLSSSDTCDTTEEGDNELFDFCDSNDLLVCGWIHTHPSQTCFLSSRDLHTSSGYQIMLPEAIAIVCAPRHNPDWGIFRLTDPPGLKHVLNCNQKGLFHPHSETNLYTDALRPGHVVEGPGLKFEMVDLRKG